MSAWPLSAVSREEPAVEPSTEARVTEVAVGSGRALCDPRGGLFLPEHGILVVSDLHLEKGSSFARRGMLLPPYDTVATLLRLAELVGAYEPKGVVSLGDSFHDREGAARLDREAREALAVMMRGRGWFWITGNHDPCAPAGLEGETFAELAIGAFTFRHEPRLAPALGEVAGHLHPCAKIAARGRALRRRCFASDGERVILPAFGAYAGSLNVLDRAYAGLFRWDRFQAQMIGGSRVFSVPRGLLLPG